MKEGKENIEELKKQIVIERLRQAPKNVKVSFGMSNGEFLNRDELIEQIEKNTEVGKRIIRVQLEYLKSFKKNLLVEQ